MIWGRVTQWARYHANADGVFVEIMSRGPKAPRGHQWYWRAHLRDTGRYREGDATTLSKAMAAAEHAAANLLAVEKMEER